MGLVFKKVTEYEWDVTVQSPDKSKFKKETFTAKFKNVGRKAFADLIDAGDENFVRTVLVGWSGIKDDTGNDGRTIIARFLRFSDKERVFKQGRKLKGTNFKMFEDIPKELHQLRKAQMEKLKQARKEGRRANFSKSEPDKLYIDGKYIKF